MRKNVSDSRLVVEEVLKNGQVSRHPRFFAQQRWVRGILGCIAGIFVASAISFPLLLAAGPATVFNDELQSLKLSAV